MNQECYVCGHRVNLVRVPGVPMDRRLARHFEDGHECQGYRVSRRVAKFKQHRGAQEKRQ